MTSTEICLAARTLSPSIRLRDVWLILKDMKERNLVVCLNSRPVTAKRYTLTLRGRWTVRQAFKLEVSRPPRDVDWRKYAQVVRAKVRRLVPLEVVALGVLRRVTATEVKRSLNGKHPLGLNPTIRALKELEGLGLARSKPVSDRDARRAYWATTAGLAVARQLAM